jgi:hypothetical protein
VIIGGNERESKMHNQTLIDWIKEAADKAEMALNRPPPVWTAAPDSSWPATYE